MDQRYIHEHHIVDKYLMGQLSPDDTAAFEEYYFNHPEMLKELEFAKSMQRALRTERHRLASPQREADNRVFKWRESPMFAGVAATLVVVLAAITLVSINRLQSLRSDNSRLLALIEDYRNPKAVSQTLTLLARRSVVPATPDVQRFALATEPGPVLIKLQIGPVGYQRVALSMEGQDRGVIWKGESELSDHLGTIELVMPQQALTSGNYYIRVHATTPNTDPVPLVTFAFEVVSQQTP